MQNIASSSSEKRMRAWTSLVCRVLITALCLFALTRLGDGAVVFGHVLRIGITLTILKILSTIVRTFLLGLRWRLLSTDTEQQLSGWEYFRLSFYSSAANLIMPGALGGDFVRSVMVANAVKRNRVTNALSVFADRLVGLFAIVLLGAFSCAVSLSMPRRKEYLILFTALIGVGVLCLSLARPCLSLFSTSIAKTSAGWLRRKLMFVSARILEMLAVYAGNMRRVWFALLLSIPIYYVVFAVFYVAAERAEVALSFSVIAMVTSLVWLVSAIPISLSGFGVREVSTVAMLMTLGVPRANATTYAMYLVGLTLVGSLTAIIFVLCDVSVRWRLARRDSLRRKRLNEGLAKKPESRPQENLP